MVPYRNYSAPTVICQLVSCMGCRGQISPANSGIIVLHHPMHAGGAGMGAVNPTLAYTHAEITSKL